MRNTMINYLVHSDIDKEKWDDCISSSVNRLPYALSWWLDCVSPGWEALVLDDYKAVMPIPCKSKFGVDYLYQPFFTQQLGIFSGEPSFLNEADQFLKAIPAKYKLVRIQMNSSNHPADPDFEIKQRRNFILDLSKDYIQILTGYHRNCRRNVQKGKVNGLKAEKGPDPSIFRMFIEKNLERSLKRTGNLYDILPILMTRCSEHGLSETLGIYSHTELLAAGWFVHFHDRILFMVCGSTSKGKEVQAMYVMIDHVISQQAGKNKILDFTGSGMPGVAYFNAGFGAVETSYPMVTQNHLPWPLKRVV